MFNRGVEYKMFEKLKTKIKGQAVLQGLLAGVITLGVLGIVLSVVADILSDINAGQTAGSFAANATHEANLGVAEISGNQSTLGTVLVAAALIGLVISAFAFARS